MSYKSRIADQLLREKLDAMGAVLIEGPKACGKTDVIYKDCMSVPALVKMQTFIVSNTKHIIETL